MTNYTKSRGGSAHAAGLNPIQKICNSTRHSTRVRPQAGVDLRAICVAGYEAL